MIVGSVFAFPYSVFIKVGARENFSYFFGPRNDLAEKGVKMSYSYFSKKSYVNNTHPPAAPLFFFTYSTTCDE